MIRLNEIKLKNLTDFKCLDFFQPGFFNRKKIEILLTWKKYWQTSRRKYGSMRDESVCSGDIYVSYYNTLLFHEFQRKVLVHMTIGQVIRVQNEWWEGKNERFFKKCKLWRRITMDTGEKSFVQIFLSNGPRDGWKNSFLHTLKLLSIMPFPKGCVCFKGFFWEWDISLFLINTEKRLLRCLDVFLWVYCISFELFKHFQVGEKEEEMKL